MSSVWKWILAFFIIALVAALLGFGGVAGLSADIGTFLLVAAVVIAIVYAIASAVRRA